MTIKEFVDLHGVRHLEEDLYELQSEIITRERKRCIGLVRMYTTSYLTTIDAIAMGDVFP